MEMEFSYIVGTGGVGKGIMFHLEGNHTLGRNESRLGVLTDETDYCKLHIILNYVAAFTQNSIPIYAVSRVGEDEVGSELLQLMEKSGINTTYVQRTNQAKTMYAVCYQFPSSEGGNISACNGANNRVTPQDMEEFFAQQRPLGKGIVLAAPEVPVKARVRLLQLGKQYGCFNVASVLTGEVESFDNEHAFEMIDLLAINEDEAMAITAYSRVENGTGDPFMDCYRFIKAQNPDIIVMITRGSQGSCTFYHNRIQHNPGIKSKVANTAGAGDCYLGTVISAIAKGIHTMMNDQETENHMTTIQGVASVAAAMKVGCKDTIDFSMDVNSLYAFANLNRITFSDELTESFFMKKQADHQEETCQSTRKFSDN